MKENIESHVRLTGWQENLRRLWRVKRKKRGLVLTGSEGCDTLWSQ